MTLNSLQLSTEAAGMEISTSDPETVVFSRKRAVFPFRARSEIMPKVEEFNVGKAGPKVG